jgi:hypothetical protein
MSLNLRFVSKKGQRVQVGDRQAVGNIGLSSIGWIGNRYKVIGRAAKPETERFWKRLRKFVACHATQIPRTGSLDGPDSEIYAFPTALAEIRNGRGQAEKPE